MTTAYNLQFAGVPFVSDEARVIRISMPGYVKNQEDELQIHPRKHQPETRFIDEINRLISLGDLKDFAIPNVYPNLGGLANPNPRSENPNPTIKIGQWYYPTQASRWSVFRGLATSSQAAAMLEATGGTTPQTFNMMATPQDATNLLGYNLSTQMYMLPPRPLSELGGKYDGLYLITLVDERYYWQASPVTLAPITAITTWTNLLSTLQTALGISFTYSTIETAWGQPEPDSQLWANFESAAQLLDIVAANIGRTFVRYLNGTYLLKTPVESVTSINSSRGAGNSVVRMAGGDIFYSGLTLPVSNLAASQNAVAPAAFAVSFPKYVTGDDPVPHFINPRGTVSGRQISVYGGERSYGDVFTIIVPIASGGPLTANLIGTGSGYIHDDAKALYSGEVQAAGNTNPINVSGLTTLALQVATTQWNNYVATPALDEVYQGTVAWIPEGLHDIIWTYSENKRQASTRVMRTEWNRTYREFQHQVNTSGDPKGLGGKTIPQTWRMNSGTNLVPGPAGGQFSGSISGQLSALTFYGINLVTVGSGLQAVSGVVTSGGINEVILMGAAGGGGGINIIDSGTYSTLLSGVNTITFDDTTGIQVNNSGNTLSGQAYVTLIPANGLSGQPGTINQSLQEFTGDKHFRNKLSIGSFNTGDALYSGVYSLVVDGNTFISGQLGVGTQASGPAAAAICIGQGPGGYSLFTSGSAYIGNYLYVLLSGAINSPSNFVLLQPAKGSPNIQMRGDFNSGAGSQVGTITFRSDLTTWVFSDGGSISTNLAVTTDGLGGLALGYSGAIRIGQNVRAGLVVSGGTGTIGSGQLGQGSVTSGVISSGGIQQYALGSGVILSINLGSGAVSSGQVAPSAIASGQLASGSIGGPLIISGGIGSGALSNGSVGSGAVQSGSLGGLLIASGGIVSGGIGNGAVNSGAVSSGIISDFSFSSGTSAPAARSLSVFKSGFTAITEEIVSGVRAVCISQSGNLRVAMSSVSGRMPAIGVVFDPVASGIQANVYTQGTFQVTSGLADYSGYLSQPLVVGRSGQIVTNSGSFNSGGFLNNDIIQYVGTAYNSGSVTLNLGLPYDVDVNTSTFKVNCQAATTTALAAYTYNNGNGGVGATITLTVAAVLVLDGYTPNLNDRLLIKNETGGNNPNNGIYRISTLGVAGLVNAVLTRTSDFDEPTDGITGAVTFIENGLKNVGTSWYCATYGSIVFGTTNINFSQYSAVAPNYIVSGMVASGAIMGQPGGGNYNIASGTIGSNELASGSVLSGTIASGSIGINHFQSGLQISGLVNSGGIGSGQIGVYHLQSGLVTSGLYLSGSIGSGQLTTQHFASGAVYSGGGINFENYLINGGMWFAQRWMVLSGYNTILNGAVSNSGQDTYGPDRWKLGGMSGTTVQGQRVDNLASGLYSSISARYYWSNRVGVSNSGKWIMYQPVEASISQDIQNKNISFQAQLLSNRSGTLIRMGILQVTSSPSIDTIVNNLVSGWSVNSGTDPTFATGTSILGTAVTCQLSSGAWNVFNVTAFSPSPILNLIPAIWSNDLMASGTTISITECGLYQD